MDIPDPISFLNKFGTKRGSVVQVMSRQSMPKNHIFHTKPQSAIFKTSHFQLFSKSTKTCQFQPFLKSIKMYQNPHQAILNSHIDTLPKIPKTTSTILTLLNQMAKGQTQYHVIHPSSSQFPIIPFPINHHYT